MSDSAPSADPASDALFREMRDRVRGIFDHALEQCSIPRAFGRKLQRQDRYIKAGSERYDLAAFSRALVVSIGKAGHSMAEALAGILGTGLSGIVATSQAPPAQLFGFRYFAGGHPLPNEDSLRAGDAILRLVSGLAPDTLVIFLIGRSHRRDQRHSQTSLRAQGRTAGACGNPCVSAFGAGVRRARPQPRRARLRPYDARQHQCR
jgi:hydroxypyruvate reductase